MRILCWRRWISSSQQEQWTNYLTENMESIFRRKPGKTRCSRFRFPKRHKPLHCLKHRSYKSCACVTPGNASGPSRSNKIRERGGGHRISKQRTEWEKDRETLARERNHSRCSTSNVKCGFRTFRRRGWFNHLRCVALNRYSSSASLFLFFFFIRRSQRQKFSFAWAEANRGF